VSTEEFYKTKQKKPELLHPSIAEVKNESEVLIPFMAHIP